MHLSHEHAQQIATLLNERNELTLSYTAEQVLEESDNYIYLLSEEEEVIACVEFKRIQWYQTEIRHLSVSENEVKKGYAKKLFQEAERRSRHAKTRLLQCSIRNDNQPSRFLFESLGFVLVSTFYNETSGNVVNVFQKVLSVPDT